MKTLVTIILTIMFIGCAINIPDSNKPQPSPISITDFNAYHLEIYVIDGCQYIGYLHNSNGDLLTHKGNCNNPTHKHFKDSIK